MDNKIVEFKKIKPKSNITYKNYGKKLDQLIKIIWERNIPVKSPDEFDSIREFNKYVASLMRQYCD